MNLIEAGLEQVDGELCARIGDQRLSVEPDALADPADLQRYVGGTLGVGIRPEHLEDGAIETGAPARRRLKGVVRSTEALGSELIAHVEIAATPITTEEVKEVAADVDASVIHELEAEAGESKVPIVARFDELS